MKRYILLITLCVLTFTNVKAQEDAKKAYLPEQGDIAISLDATPVLNFIGNMFNGTEENEFGNFPNGTFRINDITPNVSISGKYMLTDNFAVRANIGAQIHSVTTREYVCDDLANITNPLNEDKLIDSRINTKNGISALLGVEYHKGKNRIQGIFGAGALIGFNNVKEKYQYANALTTINQNPSSAFATMTNGYRTLSNTTKSNIFFGVVGNIGVEYFIAPKISLGAEVNLSVYAVNEGQTYTVTEGYNSKTDCVETRTELSTPGNRTLVFGTDNLGGSLYLSFYF